MRDSVLTLVSATENGLSSQTLTAALAQIKAAGSSGAESPVWLEEGRAADIFFDGAAPAFHDLLRRELSGLPHTDVFVQPNNAHRRKKLLMSDMDATMVIGETIDEMAAHFNLKDKIAPITARAMRGEIDFPEALRERVGLLKGMPLAELETVLAAMRYAPGAEALVKTMARFGARCILISGGFDIFTGRAALVLGFHKDYANRLGTDGVSLNGDVIPPIVDKTFKKNTLESEAREMGLPREAVLAVGDGANDIPMLQAAGAGVGYFAKPAVTEAVPHQVRHTDLASLLFMQGYGKKDFAA